MSEPARSKTAPPIIDRSDLQTPAQRTVSGVLTLLFWALWGYLWLPVLALLAWVLGLEQAYKYMVVLGGWEEVLRLLGLYTLIILLLGGSLYAWAAYNILRYGGLPPRPTVEAPTLDEVARHFRQGPIALASWQGAQRLYVRHDENGDIAQVDILAAGVPVPHEPPAVAPA
jgi:biofilm PGA synthesis protein PgaD